MIRGSAIRTLVHEGHAARIEQRDADDAILFWKRRQHMADFFADQFAPAMNHDLSNHERIDRLQNAVSLQLLSVDATGMDLVRPVRSMADPSPPAPDHIRLLQSILEPIHDQCVRQITMVQSIENPLPGERARLAQLHRQQDFIVAIAGALRGFRYSSRTNYLAFSQLADVTGLLPDSLEDARLLLHPMSADQQNDLLNQIKQQRHRSASDANRVSTLAAQDSFFVREAMHLQHRLRQLDALIAVLKTHRALSVAIESTRPGQIDLAREKHADARVELANCILESTQSNLAALRVLHREGHASNSQRLAGETAHRIANCILAHQRSIAEWAGAHN